MEKNLDQEKRLILERIANTLRSLSIDGVQKANSGHPGLPLGCAEIGAYLYGYLLRHNPKNSSWINRDRFILSAGHGSMLLYSCLHLAGFDLSLEQLKHFRQLHSQTPGHPESRETDGVETTSGPLGQGVGNAVGQALGLKLLGTTFNTNEYKLFNGKVFCLMGDGCVMEGISSEVSSLAGHLKLDNLVLIYDSNAVCLDGPLNECCSENTRKRYEAYDFDVYEVDGHDLDALHAVFSAIQEEQTKPVLIIAHTTIGKGSPNKAGSHKVHGAPLGEEEVELTKQALGLPQGTFSVPPAVNEYFTKKLIKDAEHEAEWNHLFDNWAHKNPDLGKRFQKMFTKDLPDNLEETLNSLSIDTPIAGRKASQLVLNKLGELLPQLYGGSADLSCSDLTMMKAFPIVSPGIFDGRNIKFGVREFGMATMASGLSQTQMITPFVGTFLTFSDYMRNAIRLAALMRQHVIYQFTHDSVFLGEDGPTHQPVEHYATLRAIPHLHVIRPADANEVKYAWIAALKYKGPTAILLSRQSLPEVPGTDRSFEDGLSRGAYIIKKEKQTPDFTLIATGSEVSLALDVAQELEKIGKGVRVISMPCWELFEKQSSEYKERLIGGNCGKRVSLEAGVALGWYKYIGDDGIAISIDDFGLSAPASAIANELGFTVDGVLNRLLTR
ncbi:MAG: transketolase [Chlamydiia bacterium]|nr:transketolase [Chlamydiia bacterium]